MKEVIKQIIDQYGLQIVRDEHRFCAIIDDMVPDKVDERKIVRRMCRNHFLAYLYEEILPDVELEKVNRFTLMLKNEGYSDDWIQTIMQMFDLIEHPDEIKRPETTKTTIRRNPQESTEECSSLIILQDEVVSAQTISSNKRKDIEAIILRKGVVHVKAASFANMEGLKYVFVGESVQTIGKRALADCPNLQFVELDGKKTVFSEEVFKNSGSVCIVGAPCYKELAQKSNIAMITTDCSLLTNIDSLLGLYNSPDKDLVDNWRMVRNGPFGKLIDLKDVETAEFIFTPDSVSEVECSTKGEAFIPKGYREVNVSYLEFSEYLMRTMQSLTIPEGVTIIEGSLNRLCRKGSLKRVYIPSTVEQISKELFNGCEQLSILCPLDAPVRKVIKSMGRQPKTVDRVHFTICEQ